MMKRKSFSRSEQDKENSIGSSYGISGGVSLDTRLYAARRPSRTLKEACLDTIVAYGSNVQVGTLSDRRCLAPSSVAVCEETFRYHRFDMRLIPPDMTVFSDPW